MIYFIRSYKYLHGKVVSTEKIIKIYRNSDLSFMSPNLNNIREDDSMKKQTKGIINEKPKISMLARSLL